MKVYYLFIIFFIANDSNLFSISKREQHKLAKQLLVNAKKNDFSLVTKLGDQGADLNFQDADSRTLLIYAVLHNNKDVIKYLATRNVNPNLLDDQNMSALLYAARDGKCNIIGDLLSFKNIKINQQGRYGQTALDWAYSPRLYAEQVEAVKKFSDLPKEKQEIITFLKNAGAKTANQLIEQKEKVTVR